MKNESIYDEHTINYFKVEIARKKIEIECFYKYVFQMSRNYLLSFDKPDFVIRASMSDILKEVENMYVNKNCNFSQDSRDSRISVDYVGAESTVIHRKIAEKMVVYRIILVHGAAVAVNNKCYIFIAPSGTGKTTHIKNWLKMIPGTYVVNGDKPLIDVDNKLVFGTPWCGKEGMNTNTAVPLAGIVVLERGDCNVINRISFNEVLPTLLKQCYIPHANNLSIEVLKLIGELSSIPYYQLSCNMEEESAIISYRGMNSE